MKSIIVVTTWSLLAVSTAMADDAEDLAPFLDETVFAVARIDLAGLDPEQTAQLLQNADAVDGEPTVLVELLTTVHQTLIDSSVERVFAVYSFRDIDGRMPQLIVPTPDEDSARRVAAFFYSGDPDGPTSLDVDQERSATASMFEVAEPIGSTVFCGTRSARRRLDDAALWTRQVGRVVRVDYERRTVWLNLGEEDNLPRQATFTISGDDQTFKARIEVTRILGPHIAEARIIQEDLSQPIGQDDPIYSSLRLAGGNGLGPALEAARDSAVSFVVAPTDDQRRVVRELFPTLPVELGGLGGKEIADGLRWIAAGVNVADGTTVVTAEADDEEFAVHLGQSSGRLIDVLLDESATTTVEGSRVTVTVDSMTAASPLVSTLIQSLANAGMRYDVMQSLKRLAIAIHNFHDVWASFPPSASYDEDGRPLLSWRVHLLQFLDAELYRQFHLDEPWDSPHNRELISHMPDAFKSNDIDLNLQGKTRYLVPVGDGTPWHGQVGTPIREITDGTSNTIMILEADRDHAVVWTQPADLAIDWQQPQDGLSGDGVGFHAALCDGSAHYIRADIDRDVLKLLLQHNDKTPIPDGYDIGPSN